jgi:hypothetical protein
MRSEETEPPSIRHDASRGHIDDIGIPHVLPDLGIVEDRIHELIHDGLADAMANGSTAGYA